MPIDFNLPPEVEEVRQRVRQFMEEDVGPTEEKLRQNEADRNAYVREIVRLRQRAKELGLWNPHLPPEWGGMGLGPVGMAFVSAEAGGPGRGGGGGGGNENRCSPGAPRGPPSPFATPAPPRAPAPPQARNSAFIV